MKSDHRHELKTNELAEWLGNLPQWTMENLKTIIFVSVLIVAVAAGYTWNIYNKKVVQVREQTELTDMLNQVSGGKMQILQAQAQGRDLSFVLLQPAKNLETFAQNTNNDRMAALALIKRAEALRAELHYGTVEQQYLISQTNLAKASYNEALEKCAANPSLAAAAKFGLGLCEEELGNFEIAQQIYNDIAASPDFEGTVAVVQAKRRLATMSEYKQELVFKPAPKPPIVIQPADPNLPVDSNLPIDVNLKVQVPNSIPEIIDNNLTIQMPNAVSDVPDVNLEPKAPNSVSKVFDINVPGK